MGLLNDIKLYFSFSRTIKRNRIELKDKFNIRIDNADRMYTVLNIPQDIFSEPYNVSKSDIDTIAENYIREYIRELSKFLNSKGLNEMYDYYEPIKKVEKYSYLIVIGYKRLDSVDINRVIYRYLLPFSIVSILSLILFFIL